MAAGSLNAVAVIGISCNVDGMSNHRDVWDARLREGSDFPRGPRVHEAAEFEHALFGISDRESESMDPHQRLALALGWSAFEDAGLLPADLAGTETAVYMGIMNDDWRTAPSRPSSIDSTTFTGGMRAMVANRISHHFRLQGSSVTLDTGQSSSLVAVHEAVRALDHGECTIAVAGGVHLNLDSRSHDAAAKLGVISTRVRPTLFEDDADGFVPGNGGAVVILERLEDALRQGRHIHAVIESTATGHDGGDAALVTPSPEGHLRVVAKAHAAAGITPTDLDYVELHGSGTKVGDNAEAQMLRALVSGRAEPLMVGSIKLVTGHLEGAAGILGLLSAVQVLREARVPGLANRHPGAVSAELDSLGIRLPVNTIVLPTDRIRRAGVSSLGMGGTNCHVVLRSFAGEPAGETNVDDRPSAFVVSGMTDSELAANMIRLADHVRAQAPGESGLRSTVSATLTTKRTHLAHRVGFVASTLESAVDALHASAAGRAVRGVFRGSTSNNPTAFVFPGQGSQRAGMGAELYAHVPAYARHLDQIAALADPVLPAPLLATMFDTSEDTALHRTLFTQIALFAHGVALCRTLEEAGIKADQLIGHSVGEIAAAHVAGVFDLADAVRIVVARGRLMDSVGTDGAMASVRADIDTTTSVVAVGDGRLDIAAANGPYSTVISGDLDAVDEAVHRLAEEGLRARNLEVSAAFHSHHMDAVLDDFRAEVAGVRLNPPSRPLMSTTDGKPADAQKMQSPDHWVRHIRESVRFDLGLASLLDIGVTAFFEVGAESVLTTLIEGSHARGTRVTAVSCCTPGAEFVSFLTSAVAAHTLGHEVDWTRIDSRLNGEWADLPGYDFGAKVSAADDRLDNVEVGGERKPGSVSLPEVLAALELVWSSRGLTLGSDDSTLPLADSTLSDLGMTSAMVLELRDELSDLTGLQIPTAMVFEYPTPRTLADALAHASAAQNHAEPRTAALAPRGARTDTADDPIVVISAACRFPEGISNTEMLWDRIASGIPIRSAWPSDRAPSWSEPGDHPQVGGFLDDHDHFDAAFFGISPREARAMDPQQRIALELSWEAIERASVNPASLRGNEVGVFFGAMAGDYDVAAAEVGDAFGGHRLTGSSSAVISGRVSYTLGLIGPNLTVDTACSSGATAIHLAASAISSGECELALAGGITVMSTPRMFTDFQKLGGLAPDGVCKPFSDLANGTVWSEGGGVLVLARESYAREHSMPVRAILRASAINHDGASNGLTAPNGGSQRRLIAAALARADFAVTDIDVVEAHGTGTVLGDPIEAQALVDTYGVRGKDFNPLLVTSSKSILGHTQAGAAMAGVMTVLEGFARGAVPGVAASGPVTGKVDWPGSVEVAVGVSPWPQTRRPRRAAVSSFGMSGTNVHLVLEDPSTCPRVERNPQDTAVPILMSADSAERLARQWDAVTDWVATLPSDTDVRDIARSLHESRPSYRYRAALSVSRVDELRGALRAGAALESGTALPSRPVVFVFPGQGSHWVGMGAELLRESAVFARIVDDCSTEFSRHVDFSVREALEYPAAAGLDSHRTDVVQATLFTVMVGLAGLWRSVGLVPSAVVGHSQGEVAAAYVAGALSLADAVSVVAQRSRMITAHVPAGAMAAIDLGVVEVEETLNRGHGGVEIAAVNGPRHTIVAGDTAGVCALVEELEARGHRTHVLDVAYPSHSSAVDMLEAPLLDALGSLHPRAVTIPMMSTVTADFVSGEELHASYWFANIRKTVSFAASVETLADKGFSTFVEVSPHEILTPAVTAVFDERFDESAVIGTLRRGAGRYRDFLRASTRAWIEGVFAKWAPEAFGFEARVIDVPVTSLLRQRFRPIPGPGIENSEGDASAGSTDKPDCANAEEALTDTSTLILSLITDVLQLDSGIGIEPGRPFADLGFDSLMLVDLRRRIRTRTGVVVPAGILSTTSTPEMVRAAVDQSATASTMGERNV